MAELDIFSLSLIQSLYDQNCLLVPKKTFHFKIIIPDLFRGDFYFFDRIILHPILKIYFLLCCLCSCGLNRSIDKKITIFLHFFCYILLDSFFLTHFFVFCRRKIKRFRNEKPEILLACP